MRVLLLPALALAALAAWAMPAAAGMGGGCSGGTTTAHYRIVASLGMPQKMLTQAQAKATKAKTGEIMVSGSMAGGAMAMDGMSGKGLVRHLEVRICSKGSGAVVTDAMPTITLTGANGMPARVPVATMYGAAEGMSDLHYGNNVTLPGPKVTVKVTVRGETATFRLAADSGM